MRNFWKNERPSSTESETESSICTESEAEVEISSRGPVNLNLTRNELKSEIRKLERQQDKSERRLRNQERIIGQLKTKNEFVVNKNVQLAKELAIAQSRINQLESENRQHEHEKKKYKEAFAIRITVVSGHKDKQVKKW